MRTPKQKSLIALDKDYSDQISILNKDIIRYTKRNAWIKLSKAVMERDELLYLKRELAIYQMEEDVMVGRTGCIIFVATIVLAGLIYWGLF